MRNRESSFHLICLSTLFVSTFIRSFDLGVPSALSSSLSCLKLDVEMRMTPRSGFRVDLQLPRSRAFVSWTFRPICLSVCCIEQFLTRAILNCILFIGCASSHQRCCIVACSLLPSLPLISPCPSFQDTWSSTAGFARLARWLYHLVFASYTYHHGRQYGVGCSIQDSIDPATSASRRRTLPACLKLRIRAGEKPKPCSDE